MAGEDSGDSARTAQQDEEEEEEKTTYGAVTMVAKLPNASVVGALDESVFRSSCLGCGNQ